MQRNLPRTKKEGAIRSGKKKVHLQWIGDVVVMCRRDESPISKSFVAFWANYVLTGLRVVDSS